MPYIFLYWDLAYIFYDSYVYSLCSKPNSNFYDAFMYIWHCLNAWPEVFKDKDLRKWRVLMSSLNSTSIPNFNCLPCLAYISTLLPLSIVCSPLLVFSFPSFSLSLQLQPFSFNLYSFFLLCPYLGDHKGNK